jgi:hypothetical protein
MADVVSLIDGDDEDDYEMDLELAIAASLAASQPALSKRPALVSPLRKCFAQAFFQR